MDRVKTPKNDRRITPHGVERLVQKPFVRHPSIYVLEIAGEPILAFEAMSLTEARELAKEDWLKTELLNMRSKDCPVWDGQAHIRIGLATGDDLGKIDKLLQAHRGDDDLKLVYLIQLDQPAG